MSVNDPLATIKAKNKLSDIELHADLDSASADFASKMMLKAPELKEITSAEELDGLVKAIKTGTASNNQLTKFIGIADKVLAKV